jgi:hypothetical protein
MDYANMKPLHGPVPNADTHEDALGSDIIAELDGEAAARHNVPKRLCPYDGKHALFWKTAHDRANGLLPYQQ